jgi:hypothetical protein
MSIAMLCLLEGIVIVNGTEALSHHVHGFDPPNITSGFNKAMVNRDILIHFEVKEFRTQPFSNAIVAIVA